MMRLRRMAALAALSGAVGFMGLPFGASQAGESGDFLALINSARASQGRTELQLDPALSSAACAWNANLVPTGDLAHDPNLSAMGSQIPGWTKLGENLGIGPSVGEIFTALMASPAHKKNILDASYNRVGICVDHDASNMLVTTHRFAAVGSPAPAPAPATSGAAQSTGNPSAAATPASAAPTPPVHTTPAPPETAPAPEPTTTAAPVAPPATAAPVATAAATAEALAGPAPAPVTAPSASSARPTAVPFAASPAARAHRAKVFRAPIRRVFWVRVLKNLF